MSDPTYDPIIEVRRPRAVRLFAPIPPPRRGTALVLEPREGESLVVDAGGRVPDAWLGNYLRSWVVDTTQHELEFTDALPAEEPDLVFDAEVCCVCKVESPGQVVDRRIRDMGAVLRPRLHKFLREVTSTYRVDEYVDAEEELNAQLAYFSADPAVRIGRCTVRLRVDAAVRGHAGLPPEERLQMGDLSRGALGRLMAGGDPALTRRLLASRPAEPFPRLAAERREGRIEHEDRGSSGLRERLIAHLRRSGEPGGGQHSG